MPAPTGDPPGVPRQSHPHFPSSDFRVLLLGGMRILVWQPRGLWLDCVLFTCASPAPCPSCCGRLTTLRLLGACPPTCHLRSSLAPGTIFQHRCWGTRSDDVCGPLHLQFQGLNRERFISNPQPMDRRVSREKRATDRAKMLMEGRVQALSVYQLVTTSGPPVIGFELKADGLSQECSTREIHELHARFHELHTHFCCPVAV